MSTWWERHSVSWYVWLRPPNHCAVTGRVTTILMPKDRAMNRRQWGIDSERELSSKIGSWIRPRWGTVLKKWETLVAAIFMVVKHWVTGKGLQRKHTNWGSTQVDESLRTEEISRAQRSRHKPHIAEAHGIFSPLFHPMWVHVPNSHGDRKEKDFIELQQSSVTVNYASSHENDGFKYLKYNQIIQSTRQQWQHPGFLMRNFAGTCLADRSCWMWERGL